MNKKQSNNIKLRAGIIGTALAGLLLYCVCYYPNILSPFQYFTNIAATLTAISLLSGKSRSIGTYLYQTAAPAVIINAVGWLALVLPVVKPDGVIHWSASLLLHVFLPVLIILYHCLGGVPESLSIKQRIPTLLLPTMYITAAVIAQVAFSAKAPYSWVDVNSVSPHMIIITICILGILYFFIGIVLGHLTNRKKS